jgi:hypothetical protein
MQPRTDLASTGFCLADEGRDYVAYAPRQEEIRLQGLRVGRKYHCEWFSATKGGVVQTNQVTANTPTIALQTPFTGAVIFLKLDED